MRIKRESNKISYRFAGCYDCEYRISTDERYSPGQVKRQITEHARRYSHKVWIETERHEIYMPIV